jgi:YggT family protein
MLLLQAIELTLLLLLHGRPTPVGTILLASVVQLVRLGVWVFIAAIFIQVIVSWVAPGSRNPAAALAWSLTEPLMRPLRRAIPPFGMIDITPMIAILILFIALRVLDHLVGYV